MARELELAGVESARLEAERLVASALGVERSALVAGGRQPVGLKGAGQVAEAVARRIGGEPLQYIEGSVQFREVRLVSDRRALIPRPETEQLVDRIRAVRSGRPPARRALDIGIGSGALALALLDDGLAGYVLGIDVSESALVLATENASQCGGDGRLEVRRCSHDIWSAIHPDEQFDLIVSNPPYVPTGEWRQLDSQVRDHEPRIALDGGEDGLEVIRRIVTGATTHMLPGGELFLEIGSTQGPAVLSLLDSEGGLEGGQITLDLARKARFAEAICSQKHGV